MRYDLPLIFFSAFMLFFLCVHLHASDRLVFIYTNSIEGNLEGCDCSGGSGPGLVGISAVARKMRSSGSRVVLVDCGNFFPAFNDGIIMGFMARGAVIAGYDAIIPGKNEFAAARDLIPWGNGKLPLVCVNAEMKERGAFLKSVIVRAGVTIGLTGVASGYHSDGIPDQIRRDLKFSDPAAAFSDEAGRLKKSGADLVVAVAHDGYIKIHALKKADLIITGGRSDIHKKPFYENGALVVQADPDGLTIGILTLELVDKKIAGYENRYIRPDYKKDRDADIRNLINEYNSALRKRSGDLRLK